MLPGTNGRKTLLLASWNTNGVRSRKLKLDRFLSEHGVDICLLNETHFELYRAPTCPRGHRSLCCASLVSAAPGSYCHALKCLNGGLSTLVAGDLDGKRTNSSFGITRARGSLLRDYIDRNSCLTFVPDPAATVSHHRGNPDILWKAVLKYFIVSLLGRVPGLPCQRNC
jgi:hypothetical protein